MLMHRFIPNNIAQRAIEEAEWGFVFALVCINMFQLCSAIEAAWGIPKVAKYGFSLLALALISYFRIHARRKWSSEFQWGLGVWFGLFSIMLLVDSVRVEIFYIQEVFASRYYLMPYLLPLLLLSAHIDIRLLAKVLNLSKKLLIPAVLTILYIILRYRGSGEWEQLASFIRIFDIFLLLLLLCAHMYERVNVTIYVFAYYICSFLLIGIYGRRGGFILIGVALCLALWQQLKSRAIPSATKGMLMLTCVLLLGVASIFSQHIQNMRVFERGLSKEGFDNSRSTVFNDFFEDFGGIRDWLVGRGINGTVQRTIRGGDVARGIENGYLTILLRGGLLYLGPMLLLMLRSSFLGFFRSRNDLSKALAMIVVWQLLNMMAFGLPDFSTSYVLVWVAISAGFNPNLRMLDDFAVRAVLNNPLMQSRRRLC